MYRHKLSALLLTVLLSGCTLFAPEPDPVSPTVTSVTPASGAVDASLTTTVQATLDTDGAALNPVTANETTVTLTGPEGPVSVNRTLDGTTLTLTPTAELTGETTYTFAVTSGLETEVGTAATPFASTFTTVAAPDPDSEPDPNDPGPPGAGIPGLSLTNALATPSGSRMVLTRVGDISNNPCFTKDPPCTVDTWPELKTIESGTVVFRNSGSSTLNLTLSAAPSAYYTVTPTSLSVASGGTASATVTFSSNYPKKGVYKAYVHADTGGSRASLELAGTYLPRPEGSNEPSLAQILKAAGLSANLGSFRQNTAGSPEAGSEVRARLWQRADPGKTVTVTELAAFKTCCKGSLTNTDFELFPPDVVGGTGYFFQLQYDQDYAQTMFPAGAKATAGAVPNRGTTDYSGPFRIQVDRYSSQDLTDTKLVGIRIWPVENRANTYVVGQDYALADCDSDLAPPDDGDNEVGLSANCDFQDHVYLVENIAPVE